MPRAQGPGKPDRRYTPGDEYFPPFPATPQKPSGNPDFSQPVDRSRRDAAETGRVIWEGKQYEAEKRNRAREGVTPNSVSRSHGTVLIPNAIETPPSLQSAAAEVFPGQSLHQRMTPMSLGPVMGYGWPTLRFNEQGRPPDQGNPEADAAKIGRKPGDDLSLDDETLERIGAKRGYVTPKGQLPASTKGQLPLPGPQPVAAPTSPLTMHQRMTARPSGIGMGSGSGLDTTTPIPGDLVSQPQQQRGPRSF